MVVMVPGLRRRSGINDHDETAWTCGNVQTLHRPRSKMWTAAAPRSLLLLIAPGFHPSIALFERRYCTCANKPSKWIHHDLPSQ